MQALAKQAAAALTALCHAAVPARPSVYCFSVSFASEFEDNGH
jgi:hypothetical protein